MQKRFKIREDEFELRCLETELAAELEVPFVKCSYDGWLSHKYPDAEELNAAREAGFLGKDEFIINYELYKTREERDSSKGGYDGEVHEIRYTVKNGYITVKEW